MWEVKWEDSSEKEDHKGTQRQTATVLEALAMLFGNYFWLATGKRDRTVLEKAPPHPPLLPPCASMEIVGKSTMLCGKSYLKISQGRMKGRCTIDWQCHELKTYFWTRIQIDNDSCVENTWLILRTARVIVSYDYSDKKRQLADNYLLNIFSLYSWLMQYCCLRVLKEVFYSYLYYS